MSSSLAHLKPNGDWGISGVDLSTLPPQVYGALCKLMRLEHPISSTNAEYIRALDNIELAEFLFSLQEGHLCYCQNLRLCDEDVQSGLEIPAKRCVNCLRRWLSKPYIPENISPTPTGSPVSESR